MFRKKLKWFPLSFSKKEVDSFMENKVYSSEVDMKMVCLLKQGNNLYVFDQKCPHQKASLLNADCKEGSIICPWHHYEFCLTSGRDLTTAGNALGVYKVKLENDSYFVGIEKISLF